MCTAAADIAGRKSHIDHMHMHGHCCDSPDQSEALGHYQNVVKNQIEKIRNAFLGRPVPPSPVTSMTPSIAASMAPSAAPSGDSGRRAENELRHLIDALMRLIERFANWDEAADELVEIRARLDRYGAEMRRKVQRRKQRYKLAKSIIDRQFDAVRRKLRVRETGGGGFCGGSDADDVDRELAKLRGMMHEMSLLAESIGSAQKECLLVETVQHVTRYMRHLGEAEPPTHVHVACGHGAPPAGERADINELLNMVRQNAESMAEVHFADDDVGEPNQNTSLLQMATLSGLINGHQGIRKCPHLCCQMCMERPPMYPSCCDQATSTAPPCPSPGGCDVMGVHGIDCTDVASSDPVPHPHDCSQERSPACHMDCPHTPQNVECRHTPVRDLECSHNPHIKDLDCRHTPVQGTDCPHPHTPTGHAASPCSPLHRFKSSHTPLCDAQSPHTPVRGIESPLVRSIGCCRTPTHDADIPHATRSVHTQVRSFESPSPGPHVCHARSPHSPASHIDSFGSPTRNMACSPMVAHDVAHCHSRTDHQGTPLGDWGHSHTPMHGQRCRTPTCLQMPLHRKTPDQDARQAHDVSCGQTPTPYAECPHCHGTPASRHAPVHGVFACQHRTPPGPCAMHAPLGPVCHCHHRPVADRSCSPRGVVTVDQPCSPMLLVERACSPCPELLEQTVTTGTTTVVYETTDTATSRVPSAAGVDQSTSRGSFRRVDATTSRVPFDVHRSVSGIPFIEANASTSGAAFLGVDASTSRGSFRRLDAATSRSPSGYKTIATSRGPSGVFHGVDTSTSRGSFNVDASTSRAFKALDASTSRVPSVAFRDVSTNNLSWGQVNAATSGTRAVDMTTEPYDGPIDRGVSNIAIHIKNKIKNGIHHATSAMRQMFDNSTSPCELPVHQATSTLPLRRSADAITSSYCAFDRGLSDENQSIAAVVDAAFNSLDDTVDNGAQTAPFHHCVTHASANVVRAVDRALSNIRVLAYSVAAQPVDRATSALHHGIDSATSNIYVAVDKAANDIHVVARTVPEQSAQHGTGVLHFGVEEATNAIYRAVESSVSCMHQLANSALVDRKTSPCLEHVVDEATSAIYQAVERAVSNMHDLVPGDAIVDEETCTYHDGVEEATSAIYVAVERGVSNMHDLLTYLRDQPVDVATSELRQGVAATTSTIVTAVDQAVCNVHTLVDSLADRPVDCATSAMHEGVDAATCDIYRTVDEAVCNVHHAIDARATSVDGCVYDGVMRSSSNIANFGSAPGSDFGDGRFDDLPISLRPVRCHSPGGEHRSAFTGRIPDIRVIRPSVVDYTSGTSIVHNDSSYLRGQRSGDGGGGILKNARSSSTDPTTNRPTTAAPVRATSVTTVTSRTVTPLHKCPSPVQFSTTVSNPDAYRPTPLMRVERPVHQATSPLARPLSVSHSAGPCAAVRQSRSCTASIGHTEPAFVHRASSACSHHSRPCTPVLASSIHHSHSNTEVHHVTETSHVRVARATSAPDTRSWMTSVSDAFRWPLRQTASLLVAPAAGRWHRRWWPDVDGSGATSEHALCCRQVVRLLLGLLLLLVVAVMHIIYKCREEHWPTEFVQELGLRHYGYPPV